MHLRVQKHGPQSLKHVWIYQTYTCEPSQCSQFVLVQMLNVPVCLHDWSLTEKLVFTHS